MQQLIQAIIDIMLLTIKQQIQVMIQEALNSALSSKSTILLESTILSSESIVISSESTSVDSTSTSSTLRVEEIRYFDFEYQTENIDKQILLVNADKHVYYRDVYVFVNRLKNMTFLRDKFVIRQIITTYFRDFALM